MVYGAETCARNAEADRSTSPGMCLQQTREWCGIAAKYGDAATAWANTNNRHPGDRHPPRGAPVYWTGGSRGYGHIALSLGGGKIRSTDAPSSGKVGTVDLSWPEQHWGLKYAGWAWDINEVTIPHSSSGGSDSSELHGIDVSHYQAGLELAKTDAQFVICKATEGTSYVDPACAGFLAQARKLKLPRGIYHFYQGGGAREADHFLARARELDAIGDALLALDFETHTSDVAGAKGWLDRVHAQTGIRPVIYMSRGVLTANNWSAVAKADYGLWLARWGSSEPGSVSPWSTLALWQYTDAHPTAGMKVDGDRFYGSRSAWDAYAGATTEEDDMPLTDADVEKVADAIVRRFTDADGDGEKIRQFTLNARLSPSTGPEDYTVRNALRSLDDDEEGG